MESIENLYILLLGLIIGVSIVIKSVLNNTAWSPVPFYILFGLGFRFFAGDVFRNSDSFNEIIVLFGNIGLILILFQVGVESNLKKLFQQIKNAILISIPEVSFSWAAMFVLMHHFLGVPLQTSMMLAVAFTATSIAVAISPWRDTGFLKKKPGDLILDLSAMDDIAGIMLMAMAVALLGSSTSNGDVSLAYAFFTAVSSFLFLVLLAYGFSVFIEPHLSKWVKKHEIVPDPVVTIMSLALVFAAFAGYLGLSVALGSFLIGLAFSRDSSAVKVLGSYQSLESFFIPFFFFSIGFSVTEFGSVSILMIGAILVAAILGKVVGVAVPACLVGVSPLMSLLMGIGMVSRAEVTLVVIGFTKSFFQLSEKLYTECILAVLVTCFVPLLLKPILSKLIENYDE